MLSTSKSWFIEIPMSYYITKKRESNRMKKLFLTLFTVLSLTFITSLTASAASNSLDSLPSVNELVETLEKDGSSDAMKTLEQVEQLSTDELKEFESLLNDPEKIIEELNKSENHRFENSSVDYSIVDSSNLKLENRLITPLAASNLIATATTETVMPLMGIDLVKYELVGKYTVNSTKTKILSADSMTGIPIRVWVPSLSTVYLSSKKSATSSLFTGEVTFSYDLGVGSWGAARIGVVRTGLTASPTTLKTKWLYTE